MNCLWVEKAAEAIAAGRAGNTYVDKEKCEGTAAARITRQVPATRPAQIGPIAAAARSLRVRWCRHWLRR